MNSFFNPNILKASHPFSALMGTISGVIVAWKFLGFNNQVFLLAMVFGLAQILTGLVNDYVDFESDSEHQPQKITSRGGISKEGIKRYIIVIIILLIFLPLILFSLQIALLIFIGIVIAQSYNIIFKDTPASGLIFVISFGLMAIVPYTLKFGLNESNIPIRFVSSATVLSLIAHLVNDLVDYEIDDHRNSRSMTQVLGRESTLILILVSSILVIPIQKNDLEILSLVIILNLMIFFGIRHNSYQIRELIYYLVSIIGVIIIWLIPLN